MSKVITATFADSVQARPGQKFSVLGGGINRLTPPNLPAVFNRLDVLMILEFEAGEQKLNFKGTLRTPAGDSMAELTAEVNREHFENSETAWLGAPLPPLHFQVPGRYTFELASGDSVKTFFLDVIGPVVVHMPAGDTGLPN